MATFEFLYIYIIIIFLRIFAGHKIEKLSFLSKGRIIELELKLKEVNIFPEPL